MSRLRINLNFIFFQSITIQNFFLLTYILITLFLTGNAELASKGFVTISLINLFTHGFSANQRNIYVGNKNLVMLDKNISLRLKLSFLFILICSYIIFLIFGKEDINFLVSLSILSFQAWIMELIIAENEITKKFNKLYLANSIVFIILFPISIFFLELNLHIYLIFLNIFFNIIINRQYLKLKKNDLMIFINLKLGIISTLIKCIANFVWRYSAFFLIGSIKSSVLFVAFSLGSFMVTLFDVSYGASINKRNNSIKKNIFIYQFIYIFVVLFLIILFNFYASYPKEYLIFFNLTSIFSILGSFFMITTLEKRQKLFNKKKNHVANYKTDIMSYFFNMMIIPIIFLINENYLIFTYFISSFFFYFLYKFVRNIND